MVACDNVTTVEARLVERNIGFLLAEQEPALTRALHMAFDLNADR